MTVYIGVDFHARQQTISYLTTEDGEIQRRQLDHGQPDEVRQFYGQFAGQRVVGGVREQWPGGLVRRTAGRTGMRNLDWACDRHSVVCPPPAEERSARRGFDSGVAGGRRLSANSPLLG